MLMMSRTLDIARRGAPLGPTGAVAATYQSKVEGYSPLVFWPLLETSGTEITEVINGWHGTYSGVTVDNALGPDGANNAPLWDGVNDYGNIYSSDLNSNWDPAEGSVVVWTKVFNAGVWTDATHRGFLALYVNGNNRIELFKHANNNLLRLEYEAGNVNDRFDVSGSPTGWVMRTVTWSVAADEIKFYTDATLEATATGVGTWVGNLSTTRTVIGALRTSANFWNGWLAYVSIYTSPLSGPAITDLADAT